MLTTTDRCICKAEWCYKCSKMQKGKDSCSCHEPGFVDLVDTDEKEEDLPTLAEIFGLNVEVETERLIESVEVET